MGQDKIFNSAKGDISYRLVGAEPLGKAVVYCHGFPGSRMEVGPAGRAAAARGLTFIALDRPGLGRSAFRPHWTVAEWPDYLDEVLKELGVKRFSILGVSGGTPYALCLAAAMGERVDKVVIASGVCPFEHSELVQDAALMTRLTISASQRFPIFSAYTMFLMALWFKTFPRHLVTLLDMSLGPRDREVLGRRLSRFMTYRNICEAFQQGASEVAQDFRRMASPWPFERESVTSPVTFIHGSDDRWIPLGMAQNNHKAIEHSSLTIFKDEGHFMLLDHIEEICDLFNT